MKKLFFILIIFCIRELILNSCSAQRGEWVWLHGSSTPYSNGSHGTIGTPSLTNEPPALYEPCEWTDLNGNFWFYGGLDANRNDYNDLWKYDPVANEWTWMSGTDAPNDPGVYGVKGIASPSNRPPAKSWGVASWTDLNGNFWMFGGDKSSGGAFNDLWEYTIGNNEWTWMNGSNTTNAPGVYGTQGVPDTANTPGARWECATAWTDTAGDLWLFGGIYNTFNDLWRYHIATNTWTWMKGSQSGAQPGSWGTQGLEDSTNTPSGRCVHARWKDNKGNLWLFGGYDLVSTYYNDLWRFNPSTNNWTWMRGDSIGNSAGFYGTKCSASNLNEPGGRYESRSAWTDANGNFWMFGGCVGGSDNEAWNDMWMYCVASNQWIWEGGDTVPNTAGNWGNVGVYNAANKPNGRAGAVGWTDKKGHLYLFGGTGTGFNTPYNDLWEYTIDNTCGNCASFAPPVASFQASDSVICSSDCINFTDLSIGATSWKWSFPGAAPDTSTSQNPNGICYDSTGHYEVILIASDTAGTDTLKLTNLIKVFASPKTPDITKSNDTLYCSTDPGYTSYQWYADSVLIVGATNSFLFITQSGNYNVKVTNENGCSTAVGTNVIIGIKSYSSGNAIYISPNPSSNQLILEGNWQHENGAINIYNVLGQKIQEERILLDNRIILNIKDLSSGIYFISVQNEKSTWTAKFVKE